MVISNLDEMERFESRIKYSFNKVWFHRLNEGKADKIAAIWYGAPKEKACFIGGVKGDSLLFPYSSPFAMVETFKQCKNEDFEKIAEEIDTFCEENGIKDTCIVFPPMIYDETNITKCVSAFLRDGYEVYEMGLNFQIETGSEESYKKLLHSNGRKNLTHALSRNYELFHCQTTKEKEEAYRIIAVNRENRGYYLSMTWEEVKDTIENMEHDFFVLKLDGRSIASAIIFKVTEDVNQVVYWGEIPGYDDARPMNFLPYAIHRYYSATSQVRIIDIGPSMLGGKPNYSLCDYKESIGCSVCPKFTLRKEMQV